MTNFNLCLGMQGQLWSELIRSPDQLHQLIYPRILALAERAWHEASWESYPTKSERQVALRDDWSSFAAALGGRELKRLDDLGIFYHVPLPGAR